MSTLIDYIYKECGKINIKLSSKKDIVSILDKNNIDDIVLLYNKVYEQLKQEGNARFLHPVNGEKVEELLASSSSGIVGYFKEGKHLIGAAYTVPFSQDSKFFQTPKYDKGKTVYTIGGIAVDNKFRGNGVNPTIISSMVSGIKQFAIAEPQQQISGAGFEISSDNASSIKCTGSVKYGDGSQAFKVVGMHYLSQPEKDGNIDLTVLGYDSFEKETVEAPSSVKLILDKDQQHCFESLDQALQTLGNEGNGISLTHNDNHNIVTLNDYYNVFMKDIQFEQ